MVEWKIKKKGTLGTKAFVIRARLGPSEWTLTEYGFFFVFFFTSTRRRRHAAGRNESTDKKKNSRTGRQHVP